MDDNLEQLITWPVVVGCVVGNRTECCNNSISATLYIKQRGLQLGGWSDRTKLILISTLVEVVVEVEVELGNTCKKF